jgi:hypothetical protein
MAFYIAIFHIIDVKQTHTNQGEQAMTKPLNPVRSNGLPNLSSGELSAGHRLGWRNFLGMWLSPLLVGVPVAFGIYSFGDTAGYRENISSLIPDGAIWIFLSALVFARLSAFLNFFPVFEKEKIMLPDSGNLRANMLIYEDLNNKLEGAVVLAMDGQVGRYNRANRSLGNFIENAAPVAVNVVVLSFCFPVPTFALLSVFAVARVLHQVRYVNIGYGYVGHGVGYFLGLFATGIMEGLLVVGVGVA